MSETFPEYSNEGHDVVWCLFDIAVFPEEGVIPLHYAPEAVNQHDTSFYSTTMSQIRNKEQYPTSGLYLTSSTSV